MIMNIMNNNEIMINNESVIWKNNNEKWKW